MASDAATIVLPNQAPVTYGPNQYKSDKNRIYFARATKCIF